MLPGDWQFTAQITLNHIVSGQFGGKIFGLDG
jgi:hypothetical protein